MTNDELINCLQYDLSHERKHLAFYQHAAVMVEGLHREELREFFMEEAKSELQHVCEFSDLIVHLGGVPESSTHEPFWDHEETNPAYLLEYAAEMEQKVANHYAQRLVQTHEMENAATAYAHVFYEDQIKDSQHAAWELKRMSDRPWAGLTFEVTA